MHERRKIRLNAADRSELEAVVANRNSPQKHVWRAKIVLLTAADRGTAEIMQATGKAKTVIWRWQERFRDEGAAGLWRDKTRPSRIPPLSIEVAERVVAMTLAGRRRQPATGRARPWPKRLGSASVRCSGSGVLMASDRTWCACSSCPTIRNLPPSSRRLLGCTSILRTMRSCCQSMKRARFRHWTGPSRGCR